MNKDDWKPIEELEDIYTQPLMLASPKLVDLDCNRVGISDGYWQDAVEFQSMGEVDKKHAEDGGYWVVTGWDMCNDEATTVKLFKADVTHFLIPVGPYTVIEDSEAFDFGAVYLEGVCLDAAD